MLSNTPNTFTITKDGLENLYELLGRPVQTKLNVGSVMNRRSFINNLQEMYSDDSNLHLSMTLINNIMARANDVGLFRLFPLIKDDLHSVIFYTIINYNDHQLDPAPDQAPPRIVSSERSQAMVVLSRMGKGIEMEAGRLMTAAGRKEMGMHLAQIVNATIETFCENMARTVMRYGSSNNGLKTLANLGTMPAYVVQQQINRELFAFGCLNARDGLVQLLGLGRDALQNFNCRLDFMVLPQGTRERLERLNLDPKSRGGEVFEVSGVEFIVSRNFKGNDDLPPDQTDPFKQVAQIGGFVHMNPMYTRGSRKATSHHRSVRTYSEHVDNDITIEIGDAVQHTGIWEDGKFRGLTPELGERFAARQRRMEGDDGNDLDLREIRTWGDFATKQFMSEWERTATKALDLETVSELIAKFESVMDAKFEDGSGVMFPSVVAPAGGEEDLLGGGEETAGHYSGSSRRRGRRGGRKSRRTTQDTAGKFMLGEDPDIMNGYQAIMTGSGVDVSADSLVWIYTALFAFAPPGKEPVCGTGQEAVMAREIPMFTQVIDDDENKVVSDALNAIITEIRSDEKDDGLQTFAACTKLKRLISDTTASLDTRPSPETIDAAAARIKDAMAKANPVSSRRSTSESKSTRSTTRPRADVGSKDGMTYRIPFSYNLPLICEQLGLSPPVGCIVFTPHMGFSTGAAAMCEREGTANSFQGNTLSEMQMDNTRFMVRFHFRTNVGQAVHRPEAIQVIPNAIVYGHRNGCNVGQFYDPVRHRISYGDGDPCGTASSFAVLVRPTWKCDQRRLSITGQLPYETDPHLSDGSGFYPRCKAYSDFWAWRTPVYTGHTTNQPQNVVCYQQTEWQYVAKGDILEEHKVKTDCGPLAPYVYTGCAAAREGRLPFYPEASEMRLQ